MQGFKNQNGIPDISARTLHILAMLFMLFDHLWATVIPGQLAHLCRAAGISHFCFFDCGRLFSHT